MFKEALIQFIFEGIFHMNDYIVWLVLSIPRHHVENFFAISFIGAGWVIWRDVRKFV